MIVTIRAGIIKNTNIMKTEIHEKYVDFLKRTERERKLHEKIVLLTDKDKVKLGLLFATQVKHLCKGTYNADALAEIDTGLREKHIICGVPTCGDVDLVHVHASNTVKEVFKAYTALSSDIFASVCNCAAHARKADKDITVESQIAITENNFNFN